jgi:tRNA (mo5U34)-methyltransferase
MRLSSGHRGRREPPSKKRAREFIEQSDFPWHQQFEVAPGVLTPGRNPVGALLDKVSLPELDGLTVLDVGTFNGGLAFTLERLGAGRVVAVDIYRPDVLGFAQLKELLHSDVEYVQGSVYDLFCAVGAEEFDLVFYWGVIYHLRHPLLSLDNIRSVLREGGVGYVESAISDAELGDLASLPVARFYRRDELGGDTTNWFAPSAACLEDWCVSSGLRPVATTTWPEPEPTRAMITVERSPGNAEFSEISFEVPLRATPSRSPDANQEPGSSG